MALSFSEAKTIPINEYLSQAGFEPARIRGNDYWYYSPFRHERTPSLKVNRKLNVWYDHGSGEGGTIIDLGIKLHQCSRLEFLGKLSNENYGSSLGITQKSINDAQDRKLEIISSGELINDTLLGYLRSRNIREHFARQHCKEVQFRIGSKPYEAIGFQNRSGGFELRNRWFKGSSSPKDVSFIDNQSNHLCVLEGFIDFLSLLTLNESRKIELPVNCNFLVLNSLSFLTRSIPILKEHTSIDLFLDNDLAGKQARETLTLQGVNFSDRSTFYAGYKDINELLKGGKGLDQTLARSKGFKL